MGALLLTREDGRAGSATSATPSSTCVRTSAAASTDAVGQVRGQARGPAGARVLRGRGRRGRARRPGVAARRAVSARRSGRARRCCDAASLVSWSRRRASERRAARPRPACSSSCGRRSTRSGTAAKGRAGAPRARCLSAARAPSTPTRRRPDLRPGRPWVLLPLACTTKPNQPAERSPPARTWRQPLASVVGPTVAREADRRRPQPCRLRASRQRADPLAPPSGAETVY